MLTLSNRESHRPSADIPPVIVVLGKESVGKTQLLATLTGRLADVANFRGSTVACEEYLVGNRTLVDTPGLLRASDCATTRLALDRLQREEAVVIVAQATHLDDDLADLLPLAAGKRAVLVVSYWDKVQTTPAAACALDELRRELHLPVIPLDARHMAPATREALLAAFDQAARLPSMPLTWRAGWRIEPRVGVLEHRWAGPVVAALLLLLPALAAVLAANQFAGWADLLVQRLLLPIVAAVQARLAEGSLLAALLVGDYGLFTMGPLLMVWAAPTVVLYALLLAAYKSSGLVDRINAALHPWVRHVGLAGRDVTRIVMGFGCNVPAVISTRSCSGCSRSTCISGIAFGSACSYQLPATLAVFAAAGSSWLAAPWLAWLLLTTLAYLRLTSPRAARSALNRLLVERRTFLQWPKLRAMWREAAVMLRQFFLQAMPTFVAIACLASLADWCGLLRRTASASAPLMGMFRLPAEAALPVVMASIRKDGILLLAAAGPDGQPAIALSALQLLTATYLAGVLLPCLVTALTITREQSWAFTLRLLSRQVTAAVASTLVLAWGGYLLGW